MTPQEWSRIQQGIFRGESGGDYGALFGYQNRPNGRFEGTDLTKMTVDQALDFAKPSGPYGQYVKGEVGRVATPMGAYQVVGTTLRDAKNSLGLTGNEVMDQGLQDRIGQWIYKTQGTGAWEGYKPVDGDQAIASDTMRALGKQPNGLLGSAQAANNTESGMIPEEKPRGLLGSLGIQKMVEGAEGEDGQRFFQRDSFGDAMAGLAPLLGRMGVMGLDVPTQAMADRRFKKRDAEQKASRTMEVLSRMNTPQSKAALDFLTAGGDPITALKMGIERPTDANGVQSSSVLRDYSGVVLTMRDGDIVVKTAGGETISGDAALDYVRASEKAYAASEQSIAGARQTGTNQAAITSGGEVEAARVAGGKTMERGFEAYDKAAQAGASIATVDTAIAALDDGAKSGFIYNMLPKFDKASAELGSAMNQMGLDVISSVTFGALSQAEMMLAMETAVPRNLDPQELRDHLFGKRAAQMKARDALMAAARYLTNPGNTISGWMDQQSTRSAPTIPAPTSPAPISPVTDQSSMDRGAAADLLLNSGRNK